MKIYSGILALVGDGTIRHSKMGPSRTTRSVIEIGDHILRNVKTDNFIESYLKVGQQMDILVAKFLWIKAIMGVRMNGKSYKVRKTDIYLDIYLAAVGIALLFIILSSTIGFFGVVIGIIISIFYIRFKAKAIRQYNQF